MLKGLGLSNNRAGSHKGVGFLILCLIVAGCTTIYEGSIMSTIDYKLQKEGYVLHCTETFGERCITHQWVNAQGNYTYRRYNGTH